MNDFSNTIVNKSCPKIFNTFFFETAPQETPPKTETEINTPNTNPVENTEISEGNRSTTEQISTSIITEETEEQEFILENDSIKLVLSSKGGEIKSVELKKYKTIYFPHQGIYYGNIYKKDHFYSKEINSNFHFSNILHISTDSITTSLGKDYYKKNNVTEINFNSLGKISLKEIIFSGKFKFKAPLFSLCFSNSL